MANLFDQLKEYISDLFVFAARFKNWLAEVRFQPGWERGAIGAVGVLVAIYAGYFGFEAQSGYGRAVDILVSVLAAEFGYIIFLLIGSPLIRIMRRLPPVVWVLIGAGFLTGAQVWGSRTWLHWFFNLILVLGAAILGTGVYSLMRMEWRTALKRQKMLSTLLLILGFTGLMIVGVFIFSPGKDAQPLAVEVILESPRVNALDPSLPGGYTVRTLTYGSGTDLRRPEYAEEAELLTETVDGSAYVSFRKNMPQGLPDFLLEWELTEFFYARFSEEAREFYWGFGSRNLPLNGRVWYPEGAGPFPLVLIVHGNHNMADFSDPGYAYLGELLASRGFILASVDENFLNGGFWGSSKGENDARAWLLLQHLELWEDWNQDQSTTFYQKVDLSQIALIGHSRGGEAAALAASFNRLPRYPNNARIRWDFDFDIRSVVAIAPVDEQWMPADHPNPMMDINYLILQGSHDGDVYHFDGIQQYNRASFSGANPDLFKAAVYIYRANHSQFNSSWGTTDKSGINGKFLNRKALLTANEQQQIAKLYISAFLETTLMGESAYQAIFEDYRTAGDWLPQTGYISQYEDFGFRYVADFEEDIDVTTNSLNGGRIETHGLDRWNEIAIRFRNNNRQDNHVARVDWSGTSAFYTLKMPPNLDWDLDQESVLVFKAADARKPNLVEQGLDFHVVLTDQYGQEAKLLLSGVMPLQTQFPAQISKLPIWNLEYYKEASEEVFQTYRIPLGEFLQKNPDLNLTAIQQIRFDFDQMANGIVYLDEVGFDFVP
jgi:dienelactone hydrolase